MKSALRIKQCEVNCRALFAHYRLPETPTIATLSDRTMFFTTDLFREKFAALVPGQFETWDFVRNHGTTAIRGWRERVARFSMQIVGHSQSLIEVDFDLFNPNYGAALAVGHLIEVIWRGKTDSFRVMRGLRHRGIEVNDVRQ